MARLRPHFPKSHGRSSVDDRRVLSGIIFIIRNGLHWCDATGEYGTHKTLYSRFLRCSEKGVLEKIFEERARATGPKADMLMIPLIDRFTINCRQWMPPTPRRAASSLRKGAMTHRR